MDTPNDEPNALEHLEQKLYDPKQKIENVAIHHVRDRIEKELPTSWSEDTPIIRPAEDKPGLSFGAKFLVGAVILLLVALAFTSWRVLSSRNIVSDKNIDVNASTTPYVEGGVATPFVITLQNRNTVPLEETSVTLMYKQGNGVQDEQEKIQEKRDIGTINAGDFKRQDFQVTLYGSEAESRDITVKFEYKVPGSNASFSKVIVTQMVLKTPPLSVAVDGPKVLSVGQSGTYTFTVKNNTGTTTTPTLLTAILPTNFKLEEATPKPSSRGTVWQIPAIDAGGTKVVTLTGSLSGNQGETATMQALIGSLGGSLSEVGVVYSKEHFDITLRTSPLSFSYALDTDRGEGANLRYGDRALLTIHYKNTSADQLHDARIVLSMSGDAALIKQIVTEHGYYDSTNGTITWNKDTLPELALIPASREGDLIIMIPIVTKGTNSPKLILSTTGTATVTEKDDVVAILSKTYFVQGSASISARTQYKNSPFQNSGPIPPNPNVDTTYAVHLTVSAQNALQNTKVSFVLPAYVTWRNVTTDSAHTTYDATTRTVIWNIGSLDAGKSIGTDIGISVRPSQGQVNFSPPVTSGIVLDADETVSRVHIRTTISALTTFISGETWNVNPSLVVDR
jgi:uncharacterized repeat protein (TIGR01451 family)